MTKETYKKSVDKLLTAYEKRDLVQGMCAHCAVGSILGGYEWKFIIGHTLNNTSRVSPSKLILEAIKHEDVSSDELVRKGQQLISASGLTNDELIAIETAFESDKNYENEFMGLKSVLEVMSTMVDQEIDHHATMKRLDIIHQKLATN